MTSQRFCIGSLSTTLLVLASIILAMNSLILYSEPASRTVYSTVIVSITSLAAMGLGFLVLYRQKQNRLLDKTFPSLVTGLTLWFVTERISIYYLGSASAFPSLPDVFRLVGFGFISYHLFRTQKPFGNSFKPYWGLLLTAVLLNSVGFIGSIFLAEQWIWNMLYNAGYIYIGSALLMYSRIFAFERTQPKLPWDIR